MMSHQTLFIFTEFGVVLPPYTERELDSRWGGLTLRRVVLCGRLVASFFSSALQRFTVKRHLSEPDFILL